MYLVERIKLQTRALCMLGKEEWVEFIIAAGGHHKWFNQNINDQFFVVFSIVKQDIREQFFTGFARSYAWFPLTLLNDVALDLNTAEFVKIADKLQNPKMFSFIIKHLCITLPLKFSVFSMYVSATFRASRILGATEKAARSNTAKQINKKSTIPCAVAVIHHI